MKHNQFTLAATFVLAVAWISNTRADDPSMHGVAKALQSLHVRSGFWIEAVATEPLVVDPVSARLDPHGRLWVVEMPDYPLGPEQGQAPSGRIKVLHDTDGDGRFDRADIFADKLMFATGVQPYQDGAFVTLAGKIVFIRDTDGDLVGDSTNVLFEGFAEQNQQLRANHPTLGPDGLIYVAGGLRGGTIRAVDDRFDRRDAPVDLRDRDFCFDPEGGYWGAVAGKSQFGLTIDDFGRRIGCSNRNPAMTTPIQLATVDRDVLLAARDAIADIALAASASTVVSRGQAWTTSNLHSGQFSAACGVFAPGIEDDLGEWLLVCEPTAFAVQRQRIKQNGSVWISRREPREFEFLSSSDSWFRPVDVTAGPEKSVYIVDMGRAVIEHPDFMPTELKSRRDQRNGDDLGRIWRVSLKNESGTLEKIDGVDDAFRWLESESPWQRQAATQFLLECRQDTVDSLAKVLGSADASPRAIARAAFLLQRQGNLETDNVRRLLSHADPRIRVLGAQFCEDHRDLLDEVLALSTDSDLHVVRAVAEFAARKSENPQARISALATIAQATSDRWIQVTVASAHDDLIAGLAERLVESRSLNFFVLDHLIERIAIQSPNRGAELVAAFADRSDGAFIEKQIALLDAWNRGVARARKPIRQTMKQLPEPTSSAIQTIITAAADTATDASALPGVRADCLRLAAAAGQAPDNLRTLVTDSAPPEVRAAAIPIALSEQTEWTRDYLSKNLAGMTITIRDAAVRACLRSTLNTKWLLSAIADGIIPRGMIDPSSAKRLRQHSDNEVRELAEKLLATDPDRAKVLSDYAVSAKRLGDPAVGRTLFREHCAACHRIDGYGTNVGPDISDSRTKTPEALLVSILDPNAAIDSAFVQYNLLTIDGRLIDGLMVDETVDAITLQQKGDQRVTVPRADIDQIQTPGVSLMPEGFEKSLDTTSMSHLLSYLKNWRYLGTSIPVDGPGFQISTDPESK